MLYKQPILPPESVHVKKNIDNFLIGIVLKNGDFVLISRKYEGKNRVKTNGVSLNKLVNHHQASSVVVYFSLLDKQ